MDIKDLEGQDSALSSIDLQEYLNVLIKRRYIFLICFMLPVVLITAFSFISKPVYRVVTKIQAEGGFRMPLKDVYQDVQVHTFLNTQIELMKSDEIKKRIDKDLTSWKEKIPESSLDPKVTIARVGSTSLINISVDGPYREYALAYTEALNQEYLNFKREQKEKSSEFALLSLTRELDKLNEKLTEAQTNLDKFRRENNGVAIEEYGNFSPRHLLSLAEKISDLDMKKELIARQIKALEESDNPSLWISIIDDIQKGVVTPAISKEAQPETTVSSVSTTSSSDQGLSQNRSAKDDKGLSVTSTSTVEQLPFVFILEKGQSKNWEALKTKYDSTKSELARISGVYKPQHPERIRLENESAALVKEMKAELASLLVTFKAKYNAIQLEEDALKASVDKWQKSSIDSSSKIGQLEALKGEVDRLQKLYDVLIKRVNEIEVSSDFGQESISIVEPPRILDDPIAPKKARNFLLSVFFGLCLGLGAVFSLEYLDDSVKSVDELKKYIGITCLGVLHSIEWNNENLPSHKITVLNDSETLEAYRSIRTNILLSSPENALKTILVTSSIPSEGKTTSAANISIVLAQGGLKVLLIDGDLRRPTIHKLFNMENKKGFSSVLLGSESYENCVKKTDIEGLDVLTAGQIVPDPPKLFHYAKTKEFLNEACRRYDKVIIDSAPVLTVSDSVILSEIVDGLIFVLQGALTSRSVIAKAKEALLDNSSKIVGAIINNLPIKKVGSYYYGYKYKYRYGYKHGYSDYLGEKKKKTAKKKETEDAIV